MMTEPVPLVEEMERRLRAAFAPQTLEIVDDSARHAGHPGASSGGGHFQVTLVSEALRGLGRLEQHRAVYAALDGLIGGRIHALALRTGAPD